MKIDFSKGWLPDLLPYEMPDGGLIECKNLLPCDEYYSPLHNKKDYSSDAVSGTPLSAKFYRSNAGTGYLFIGTSTKLQRMNTNKSISDITRLSGGDYSATQWCFEQCGEWIVFTDYADDPQVLKGLDTANVVALGGTPPKSKYLLYHHGHLIHAYVNDSGTVYPKKIKWSAHGNAEDYTASLTTGAGSEDLLDADGEITGIANIGNNFGVFHRNSITLGGYIGAPLTFKLQTNYIKGIGAIPGTIINVGSAVVFWSDDDIYYFDGVNTPQALGYGIRQTILDNINEAYKHRITAAHDKKRGIVYWLYCTTLSTGTPDKMIAYNYKSKRFAHLDLPASCIFDFGTAGYDIETIAVDYPYLDAIPYSLDSNYWNANAMFIGCVNNTSSKVATFTGDVVTGEIETGELSVEDRIIHIKNVRPKVERATSSVYVKLGYRFKETDDPIYTAQSVVGVTGYANIRATGKFLRVNIQTGTHTGINNCEVDVVQRGKR